MANAMKKLLDLQMKLGGLPLAGLILFKSDLPPPLPQPHPLRNGDAFRRLAFHTQLGSTKSRAACACQSRFTCRPIRLGMQILLQLPPLAKRSEFN